MSSAKQTFNIFVAGLIVIALIVFGDMSQALAQSGIDVKSRDLLIDKLAKVHLNLAPSDPSKVAITLRLADLKAERARVSAMKEIEDGCTKCVAGRDDRLKALALYREVLPKVPESSIGKVLTQIGHLYELVGNEREAIETYLKIVKEMKAPEAIAEAQLSLGEVFFKRRQFATARGHFEKVTEFPQAGSRGLAFYRIAWCQFNEGKIEPAIAGLVKILRTPELLSRSSRADLAQADRQFSEEVSRDLATFFARRPVTAADAALLFELSPEQIRLANIVYLANETERLGQIKASIEIWRMSVERERRPQARLEGHVHLAQLEMSQKLLADAIRDFEMALALWPQVGACPDGECKELKTRIRNFVVDWNRTEKKSPSEQLFSAYKSYIKAFPGEADILQAAAAVAIQLKSYPEAFELFQKCVQIETKASLIETALLGGIEAAELAKDAGLREAAYDAYLAKSLEKKKTLEVRYQKANLLYDKSDYRSAVEALREVALTNDSTPGAQTIRKQAADLSLDGLVLLKDDARLEVWAGDYAKAFPKDAKEFSAISRKSVLTQSTQVAQAKTPEALDGAWATLMRFDLASASQEDRTAFYKNKLILAEKTRRYSDARDAAEGLLQANGVSAEDREFALSRKAWLAELVLDFETALTATQKITPAKGAEPTGRSLKLAMYAELANRDASPFYGQFLRESKDEEKNALIAAKMVRESKDPLKEIERHRQILAKRPELLGELYLDVFAKTPTLEISKRALATQAVAASPSGKAIARALFLDDVAKLRTRIVGHQLDASSQKKMAQTLKARAALLDESEKLASRAVQTGDWTSQLVALDLLAKQSDRFYQEVLSLPLPSGLSPEDEQQYLSLLSQQAAPHQVRAVDIGKKVSEFWSSETALTQLEQALDSEQEQGARRGLLKKSIAQLIEAAPEAQRTRLQALAAKPASSAARDLPTLVQLEKARQQVRLNPMNRSELESLLELERKLGRQTMVTYLEARLQSLGQSGAGEGVAN